MDIAEDLSQSRDETILALRELSRRLVRELGFMRPALADSGLAPSAVHAIIEVGMKPGIQGRDLAELLRLDKSNASRQVAKLEALGLLRREPTPEDARGFGLFLTRQGAALRAKIDRFATGQVSRALRQIAPPDQQALLRSLALYANALSRDNPNRVDAPAPAGAVTARVHEGYLPGCIGDIAALHGRYYAQAAGFGAYFERKVATELGAFAESLPASGKSLWLYVDGGRVLGSIAIDAHEKRRLGHLRWFIVDESLQGMGVGRELLARAMAFADTHYEETHLWTFKGLEAARHLYETAGFVLAQEAPGAQWGKAVVEQRFLRRRPQDPAGPQSRSGAPSGKKPR
jgi:DNA-binding MarR family transcriptional regulator/RimJ/RimL family protein N-acetyltransferase